MLIEIDIEIKGNSVAGVRMSVRPDITTKLALRDELNSPRNISNYNNKSETDEHLPRTTILQSSSLDDVSPYGDIGQFHTPDPVLPVLVGSNIYYTGSGHHYLVEWLVTILSIAESSF